MTLCRKDSLCTLACRFCVSRSGGGHSQGAVHMVTARLGCTNRPRKLSPFGGGLFLAGKASWVLSGCLPTENADYYRLVNECPWLRSRVCLLRLKVDLGSVLESELR